MNLRCSDHTLDLTTAVVMGVLNVTPDSFSDGGAFVDPGRAVAHAHRMVEEGAAIVDVGGESTRPGAGSVSVAEEIARIEPVVRRLAAELDVPVSIDTSKPGVMRAAVEAGAGFINDVTALRAPGALECAADCGVPVCLMHMQGEPGTMQVSPRYDDVVEDIADFLATRVAACEAAGIPRERLVVDPGFGFGKTLTHNLLLLQGLPCLKRLGLPLLVGISRKSMIRSLVVRPADTVLAGSLAAATLAVWQGANIVRAHDVAETVDVLKIGAAVRQAGLADENREV